MTDITVTPEDEAATADLFEAMGETLHARVIRSVGLRGKIHRNAAEFLAVRRIAAIACIAAERARGQKVAEALREVIGDLEMRADCKLGDDNGAVDVGRGVWIMCDDALAEWEAGK
jgi:hypothetical protein